MNKVPFIYFDVGGVVIKDFSDTNKWQIMMDEMGVARADYEFFDQIYKQYENEICAGQMTIDELLPIISKQIKLTLPTNFSWLNYFVNHFEVNSDIWPIIQQIKLKAKIGLLTGQYPGMLALVISKKLFPPIKWDVVVDSSIVGYSKPDQKLYEIAQEKAGVTGSEILFIDNREKNLIPARALGWQTFLYDSSDYTKANKSLLMLYF